MNTLPDLSVIVPLIDVEMLQQRIQQLAEHITVDYQAIEQQPAQGLVLVGVLTGVFMFMADLCRQLSIPHRIQFLSASSYGDAQQSTGEVMIQGLTHLAVHDQHVIIVDEIIDSGHTLARVMAAIKALQPASIKLCTLLDKPSRRKVSIPVDYVGFTIEDQFVIGYGLDCQHYYRNLPYVAVVKQAPDQH